MKHGKKTSNNTTQPRITRDWWDLPESKDLGVKWEVFLQNLKFRKGEVQVDQTDQKTTSKEHLLFKKEV